MSSEGAKVACPDSAAAEGSGSTVEIKIKTLDSQTYTMRVDKFVPVPALKEQIATITGVVSEQQRLICRGRVLKDDQLLSAYHVEDGHTLHLVVRQPHDSSVPSSSDAASANPGTSGSGSTQNPRIRSFVFEAVNMGQSDLDSLGGIEQYMSGLVNPNGGFGNILNEIREFGVESFNSLPEMMADTLAGENEDGQASSFTQPNFARRRTRQFRSPASPMPSSLVIPDSLTTLNDYLGLLREEFTRAGLAINGNEYNNNAEASGVRRNAQGGLPSPASLAEILQSTRRFLLDQTSDCLHLVATRLEEHERVTDPSVRMATQATALRSGVLLQNLGAMLLELGRTTMTLRMGQTPSEAVVNAGPANYISSSGPNPLMVQFVPGSGFGSMHMGSVNSGHTEQPDAPPNPRNVEIRIRAVSRGVPASTANAGNQAGTQTPQQQAETARNYAANIVRQMSGISGGESGGVRVVPIRTVVAVPSGVFPTMMARMGQPSAGNANDPRSGSGVDQQATPVPASSHPANESTGRSSPMDVDSHEAASGSNDQGVFFANLLQQIMPVISQSASFSTEQPVTSQPVTSQSVQWQTNTSFPTEQTNGENLDGSSSSQHPHDEPEPPSPKRRKSE